MAKKTGPLTRGELIELWKSVTDRAYWEPLLEDDTSRAIIEAIADMYARASQSVDTNTQAMFILPHSSQTAPPASGQAFARTTIRLTRTRLLERPLVIRAGQSFEHWIDDWGPEGPVPVTTKRRYLAVETVAFGPGEPGPIEVEAVAELPGYGYNVPAPGTISRATQVGARLSNNLATIVPGAESHELRSQEVADVPILANVGSTVYLSQGANAGQYRHVLGFVNPVPGQSGGGLLLAADGVVTLTGVVGAFQRGEALVGDLGFRGTLLRLSGGTATLRRTNSTSPAVAEVLTGATSGATGTIDMIRQDPGLVAETGTARWTVLDFVDDFGLVVANIDQPSGGASAMLDGLGSGRGIDRGPGEGDDPYRQRVAVPADVVSPNAIRRAGNRILRPLDLTVCLREFGTPRFPGWFYDHDFYDYGRVTGTLDTVAGFRDGELITSDGPTVTTGRIQIDTSPTGVRSFRGIDETEGAGWEVGDVITGFESGAVATMTTSPVGFASEKRWNLPVSLSESRRFFMLGVPGLPSQGWFYDAEIPDNFYDADTVFNFFDAPDLTASALYRQVYQAVAAARAAGVQFRLYIELDGCA